MCSRDTSGVQTRNSKNKNIKNILQSKGVKIPK
jgi:hypothetical protein